MFSIFKQQIFSLLLKIFQEMYLAPLSNKALKSTSPPGG